MINFGHVTKECKILRVGGSGSGKMNSSFNLINRQTNIDQIDLYAKDPYESKYRLIINKREIIGLKHFNDTKDCIQYSNDMADLHKNIDENSKKKNTKCDLFLKISLLMF